MRESKLIALEAGKLAARRAEAEEQSSEDEDFDEASDAGESSDGKDNDSDDAEATKRGRKDAQGGGKAAKRPRKEEDAGGAHISKEELLGLQKDAEDMFGRRARKRFAYRPPVPPPVPPPQPLPLQPPPRSPLSRCVRIRPRAPKRTLPACATAAAARPPLRTPFSRT
jgi:hypothetical protein